MKSKYIDINEESCILEFIHNSQCQDLSNIDTNCEVEESKYPTFALFKFLTENSFIIDNVHIIKDEEYMILPSSPLFNSNLNAIVKMGQEEMDLKDNTTTNSLLLILTTDLL